MIMVFTNAVCWPTKKKVIDLEVRGSLDFVVCGAEDELVGVVGRGEPEEEEVPEVISSAEMDLPGSMFSLRRAVRVF